MAANIYTVKQINAYIKNMFEQDFMLNRISMRGEVSNCKYHSSGHVYFSLKDESGTISCVMFAGNRKGLNFRMEEGHKVVVTGKITVYERDGSYQMYANKIELDGIGQLYLRFEALKRELEEMGMFAKEYKRPIPPYSYRIGVVTAPTGAAVRDIIQITKRRNPYVQLILYPAQVQGAGAAESIADGIQKLDAMGLDVLIVGRGGGSIEDLWAFNEEMVARAIFECETPVISAVGHETDTTIADYVADLRAPTPSAAAELAVFEIQAVYEQMQAMHSQMMSQMNHHLELSRKRIEQYGIRLKYASPMQKLQNQKEKKQQMEELLRKYMRHRLQAYRHKFLLYAAKLEGASPLKKLEAGYSYIQFEKKSLVSVEQVQVGDVLDIQLADGAMRAAVTEKKKIKRESISDGK